MSYQRNQHGRNRKKEDDSDALMRLVCLCLLAPRYADCQPDKEIAGCINDIGVPFSVNDLMKPNPQQIQMVFEWFAELLMNATRETIDPAMRAAADDIAGEHTNLFSADTRNLLGFFISLRRLMVEVGPP